VLAGLGALEVGARIVIARRPVVTLGEQTVYSEFDPVLGWRNRPGVSVTYRRREYQTKVTVNSLGFRDVEHPREKVPGVTRVLAMGDSFIEGFTVELEESMTRRAEAIGLGQGCPVEVVNAGVHGYSTDQEALWFAREAEALHPDVVLVFVYYNDILNNTRVNYWGLPKPLTRVIDGQIVPVNLPLPRSAPPAEAPREQPKAPSSFKDSALKSLVVERIIMGAPGLHRFLTQAGLLEPQPADDIPDELRAYKTRGPLVEFDEAWKSTREILVALGDIIRARHARPVLVHVPARFEISERDWSLTTSRYGIDPKVWDRTLVRRRLEEIASTSNWAFLDLTEALRARTGALLGEPYFQYDGHWNARGHDAAASAVVAFLRQRNLLPCAQPPA
jgi:hypothetical protein